MAAEEFVPLTHAEKRIYVLQKLHPESCMWNVPCSLRLAGGDADLLYEAVCYVQRVTVGLNCRFTEEPGFPAKILDAGMGATVERIDFSDRGEQAYQDWADEQSAKPLPMLNAAPYRLAVADAGGGTVFFYCNLHHLVGDGGGSDVVNRRVFAAYEELVAGREPQLDAGPAIGAAYAVEQEYMSSPDFEADKAYWKQQFETIPEPMDLSGHPPVDSMDLEAYMHRFSAETRDAVMDWCAREHVSPFRVVLAAMSLVMSRTLRREDVVMGTATYNRHPDEMRDAVGMFVSTSALRLQVEPDVTFAELVKQASQRVRSAVAHERYPYDMLSADLRAKCGDAPNLIACTLVEKIRAPLAEYAEVFEHNHGESLISLSCYLHYPHRGAPAGTPLEMFMTYNEELFESWRIEELAQHTERVLMQGVSNPATPVNEMNLLGLEERIRLVERFNETESSWEVDATLHGYIVDAARRFPGRKAVVYRGKSLTYAELDAQSNALARKLQDQGAGRGEIVGLLADRSVDIVVAQLAILKSGAAFMPIDADYPDTRIQFMLEDVEAPLILTQSRFIDGRDFGASTILNMDAEGFFAGNESPLANTNDPHDLAAVIYTSGSTGKPKGALLEHRSICNVVQATIVGQGITSEDRISKHACFSFDASMLEIFVALMSGAALHVLPDEIRLSLGQLNEYYEKEGITWAFLTTQLGEQFMDFVDNHSLRTLVVGGEKLRVFKERNYQLINGYGPTECSIYATLYEVNALEDNIPIGRPVSNCFIYILDAFGKPQPAGYAGELCIGGPGVGRGYHNRPEKTAATFVPNPFIDGETMYRTGDLACWRNDGQLLHLGRIDRQVKLRGFRIELGEIENAMLSMDGLSEAAVVDFKDSAGHVFLCGYFCGDQEADHVLEQLEHKVPEFMVPANMIKLDAMPVNASGKIDRKQLLRPEQGSTDEAAFIQPEGELETAMAKIWGAVLEQEKVSADADFFRSGGDSLKAVALQLQISREVGREIELAAIFSHCSPRNMAAYVDGLSGEKVEGIPQAEPAEFYPAIVSQQQLYLLSKMEGIGTAYNMPLVLTLTGELDSKKLSSVLLMLLERHEALRAAFEIHDGHCMQRIVEQVHLKLEYSRSDSLEEAAIGFVRPFDLANPPLMRARLVEQSGDTHWLLLDFHHIAFDGVSVGVFLREMMAAYSGETLGELRLQQKDVAAWELQQAPKVRAEHQDFWYGLFANPPEAELPVDHARSAAPSFSGAVYRQRLEVGQTVALRELARKSGATLHQVFMAALAVLTGRWSDSDDVCIGTSMSGRERGGTAEVVGMFVRTLPLRLRPDEDKTFAALLDETAEQMRDMHEHGAYPISCLYEHLGVNRGSGRHPLFDINFVMRNTGMDHTLEAGNLQAELSFLHTGTAKFDLSFAVEEDGETLALEVDYRDGLYERDTIVRMVGHLTRILELAVKQDEQPLAEMDMLVPEERDSLRYQFNPPPTLAPAWPTVADAVARHAMMQPDSIAVVAEDRSLTYAELDQLANRVARAIVQAGGGANEIVAVVADRSTNSVVGMLAALKSGSAYVGLDVHYPSDRVAFILEDTAAPCVVGTTAQLAHIEFDGPKVTLDELPDGGDMAPDFAVGGGDLAYCIFTSGSTGKPKGVLIEHTAMVNFIQWYGSHHCMQPGSQCAAFASFSFDVSVVQVFAPLAFGSTLHVIPEELRRDPPSLEFYFEKHDVSHAHFPTQFAEQYMRLCDIKSLGHLVVGGDKLKNYSLGDYVLTNEYGPSETAMACLSYDVSEVLSKPPIGTPVANTRIYILDGHGRFCPIGMPGEICVAGRGVGRGYLNRPELTAERFVEDPFVSGERMFRTGDKGRWLDDGNVDFIGRMDFQLKIRGYRIEPGEIEARIKEERGVTDCVVVALEESSGNKVLAAYCSAANELNVDELRSNLKTALPEYMVPGYIVQLEKLPLNPNGKVDRSKLPRPEITSGSEAVEPRNLKERRIVEAWQNVLGHRGFGLFDSFYDVGGDSLSAIALLADLSEHFDITASDLFAYTTVADQAAHFAEAVQGRSARLLRLKGLLKQREPDAAFLRHQKEYEAACEADAALDADTVKPFAHVLLTGATGTLGIYLLRELLGHTDAKVSVLVRAASDDAALARVNSHYLERFGCEPAGDFTVLAGDLSKPRLGLEESRWKNLSLHVDAILHSAALTSHYGQWKDFVAANIKSAEHLLKLLRAGNPKVLHHISTTSIGAGRVADRSQVLFTEFDLDIGQSSGNLYVHSKLDAEKLLAKAREEGLPINVYRAGNIACDSETGAIQRNVDDNAFFQQLRAYVNLGAAPDKLDVRNITYVDQAAKAIVVLMARPGLSGQTFHIQNPNLLSLSSALSDAQLDLRVEQKSFSLFIDYIAGHAGHLGFEEFLDRLMLHLGWQDWLGDPDATACSIRVERSAALLKRCGFNWKVPEATDLREFVKHALKGRIDELAEHSVFSELDTDSLCALASRIKPEYFLPERLLQQEHQPTGGLRMIVDGMVETYRRSANGWLGTVRVSGPGATVGEESIPADAPAANTVEAIDGVFAYEIDAADLRQLIAKHPGLALALLATSTTKTDQAERLFVAM